jgi:hypothetical protein
VRCIQRVGLKIVISISLILILGSTLVGSEYYWLTVYNNNWKNINRTDFLDGKVNISVLNSLDSIFDRNSNLYHIYFNGNELLSFSPCGFDLYSINKNSIEKIYKFDDRGYVCDTKPFVRDSINYLLGGYGFWSAHLDLMRFDEIQGSWEFVKTINQPIDYFSNVVYQNDKGIYSLFGSYYNPRTGIDEKEAHGYFLDWVSKEWTPINIDGLNIKELVSNQTSALETKDYLFSISNAYLENIGWNIIEKETGKIFSYDLKKNEFQASPFVEIIGNKVNYISEIGDPSSIDLDVIISKSKEVGSIKVIKQRVVPFHLIKDILYVSTIFMFLIGLIIIRAKGRKKEREILSTNSLEEIEKIVEIFRPYAGELLNTEKLDILLDINSTKNFDSKRLKRSRMITRLNNYYQIKNNRDLIIRIKNPEDKRFNYYKIRP